MNTNQKIGVAIGVTSIVSAAAGSISGYLVAKKRLEKMYSDLSEKEIDEARRFYSKMHIKEYQSPAEAVDALIPEKAAADAILAYQGVANLPESDVVAEEHNVFEEADPDDDAEWEREVATRRNTVPYIISEDEFLTAESAYSQVTLLYYEGDNTLADERDQPIEEVEQTIGLTNLRFGYRCGDKNVVHIRNDKLALEFEVVRSTGKYSEEVLGHKPRSRQG